MHRLQEVEQREHFIKSKAFDLMTQINTASGFYEYYVKILTKFNTRKDAFEMVNTIYCLLFKHERYASYESFKNITNKKIKKFEYPFSNNRK